MSTRKRRWVIAGKLTTAVLVVSSVGFVITPYLGGFAKDILTIVGALVTGGIVHGVLKT